MSVLVLLRNYTGHIACCPLMSHIEYVPTRPMKVVDPILNWLVNNSQSIANDKEHYLVVK